LVAIFTNTGDSDGLVACDRGLAAAEARRDELAAVTALGQRGAWCAQFGDAEQGALDVAEALRRAERAGHPPSIQATVLTAAGRHLWKLPGPDFAASLAIFAAHDQLPHFDDTIGMWFDVLWGATLVGLHHTGAVGRLARAVRLADRLSNLNAADLALRLLAIAVAESGYQEEAATMAGYAEANLRQHRILGPGYAWPEVALDDALAGYADRATHETGGAASARSHIMALVSHLDSTINSGPPTAVVD
jgi:hypothetical protein